MKKGLSLLLKAEALLSDLIPHEIKIFTLTNLSSCYFRLNNPFKSLSILNSIAPDIEDQYIYSCVILNISSIKVYIGKHEEALELGLQAIQLLKDLESNLNIITTQVVAYRNIASICEALKQHEKAAKFDNRARELAMEKLGPGNILTISLDKSKIYANYTPSKQRSDSRSSKISTGMPNFSLSSIRFLTGDRLQPMFQNKTSCRNKGSSVLNYEKRSSRNSFLISNTQASSPSYENDKFIQKIKYPLASLKEVKEDVSSKASIRSKVFKKIKIIPIRELETIKIRNRAAIVIQKNYRGFMIRKLMKGEIKDMNIGSRSCTENSEFYDSEIGDAGEPNTYFKISPQAEIKNSGLDEEFIKDKEIIKITTEEDSNASDDDQKPITRSENSAHKTGILSDPVEEYEPKDKNTNPSTSSLLIKRNASSSAVGNCDSFNHLYEAADNISENNIERKSFEDRNSEDLDRDEEYIEKNTVKINRSEDDIEKTLVQSADNECEEIKDSMNLSNNEEENRYLPRDISDIIRVIDQTTEENLIDNFEHSVNQPDDELINSSKGSKSILILENLKPSSSKSKILPIKEPIPDHQDKNQKLSEVIATDEDLEKNQVFSPLIEKLNPNDLILEYKVAIPKPEIFESKVQISEDSIPETIYINPQTEKDKPKEQLSEETKGLSPLTENFYPNDLLSENKAIASLHEKQFSLIQKTSASLIQKHYRNSLSSHLKDLDISKSLRAIIILQSHFRRYKQQKAFRLYKTSAIIIQKNMRMHSVKVIYKSIKDAIVFIQAHYRRHSARKSSQLLPPS